MRCAVCGKGPMDGITIYRLNRPGDMPPLWACRPHMAHAPDKDLEELVEILEEAGRTRKQ